MNTTRQQAHEAMRELWETADTALRRAEEALPINLDGHEMRTLETESGAEISRVDDLLFVTAEFEKPDGSEETVRVEFPEDIRDLSITQVVIDWANEGASGTNTPPLRDFSAISRQLMDLI